MNSPPAAPGPLSLAAAEQLAAKIIGLLTDRGQTVAVAESLTGGLVAATLTSVPGSSLAFAGGVVVYATSLKATLLGVPEQLLARHGPVHPDVAEAMASGARLRLNTTFGVATTGVAGPGPADGQPAGTVFIAVSGPGPMVAEGLALPGDRRAVRIASVAASLRLLARAIGEDTR